MQRGIFLIHKLLYKDEHFVVNAGDCEGYYELFLHAGSTFEPPIHLHQASSEFFKIRIDNIMLVNCSILKQYIHPRKFDVVT